MAYKFQFGTARLSGALEQEGHVRVAGSDIIGVATAITSTDYYAGLSYDAGTESGKLEIASGSGDTLFSVDTKLSGAVMNTLAGSGLAFDQSSGALSVDLNEASAAVVDVAADSFTFIDATDGSTKKDSYADYATAIAGLGIAASAGALALDFSELSDEQIASGDKFAFRDITDDGMHADTVDDLATLFAGSGLSAASAVLAVNVSGAAVIASDKIGISGSIAGDGLAYAGGVNSISGLSVNVDDTGIELSSDSLQLKDNGVTLAKMADIARGSIISGDASGDPQALAVGSANQFLQSDGNDLAYVSMSGDATLAAGVLSIGATKVTDAMINDDVATGLAGDGLAASSGVLAVNVSGAVKLASDTVGISGSIAGAGLAYAGGVNSISALSLDFNELASAAVNVGADSLVFIDANGNVSRKDSFADYATAAAGDGLAASSGQFDLDLNELTAAVVNVAADSIAIVDADDNSSKKESIADLVTAMAGAGLTAASGVLAVDGNSVTSKDFSGAFALSSGYNYSDGTAMGGSMIATLPDPTENGQMVSIKAPSDCSGTNYVTIAGGTIDGQSTHRLESPYAAITLICVDSDSDIWILI